MGGRLFRTGKRVGRRPSVIVFFSLCFFRRPSVPPLRLAADFIPEKFDRRRAHGDEDDRDDDHGEVAPTMGMFPKKLPPSVKMRIQAMPPGTSYAMKRR